MGGWKSELSRVPQLWHKLAPYTKVKICLVTEPNVLARIPLANPANLCPIRPPLFERFRIQEEAEERGLAGDAGDGSSLFATLTAEGAECN